MFKQSLVFIALTGFLFAKDINSVVNDAINKNNSLKAIEKSLDIAKEQINLSSKWQNPTLSFGITDIQFNDISKRDLEPMQAYFVGFSQVIPITNKKSIEQKIARNDYELTNLSLEDKKLQLKAKIYEYIYTIKLVEQKVALFSELKQNVQNLQNLLEEFYKYNKASQIDILKVQTLYDELDISLNTLKNNQEVLSLQLEQLTYTKYEDININTTIKKVFLSTDISNHPKILQLQKNIQKYENTSLYEKKKKNSDIMVSVNYFQRDSKFEDYVNLSVAIPLSVYDSENIKALKAKHKASEYENLLKDLKINMTNEIKIIQQNMNNAFYSYKKLNENIIPKYNQIQKTLESYNRFSSLKQINSKQLIRNLNELINYKLKAIDEKQKFFTLYSNSIYFTKANK